MSAARTPSHCGRSRSRATGGADPRAGKRAARRAVAARLFRPDPGLRRHRRRVDGMRITGNTNGSRSRGAGDGQRGQPGRARQRRRHRRGPADYLEYLVPVVQRRRAGEAGNLPVVDGLLGYRLPDGSALDDVEVATQMLCVFIGGTETVPKIVAHGLWELQPTARPAGGGARRPDRQRADRARGDDPLLRAGAMVRPNRAQTLHHPRHHDQAGAADHHPAGIGEPRRAGVSRARRVHLGPADQALAGLRSRPALLHRLPPGSTGDRGAAGRMAAPGAGLRDHRRRPRPGRRPASSGAGTSIPVEV